MCMHYTCTCICSAIYVCIYQHTRRAHLHRHYTIRRPTKKESHHVSTIKILFLLILPKGKPQTHSTSFSSSPKITTYSTVFHQPQHEIRRKFLSLVINREKSMQCDGLYCETYDTDEWTICICSLPLFFLNLAALRLPFLRERMFSKP